MQIFSGRRMRQRFGRSTISGKTATTKRRSLLTVVLVGSMILFLISRPSSKPFSIYDLDWGPTEDPAPCVFAKWPNGYGNMIIGFVSRLIENSRYVEGKPVFPCSRGYGEVLAPLFQNVPGCGLDFPLEQCAGYKKHKYGEKTDIQKAQNILERKTKKFPSLLQLNATNVNEIFSEGGASFTVEDLRESSCAVHVRFGDFYTREDEAKRTKKEKRLCPFEKDIVSCFDSLRKTIGEEICPDPNIPFYLATDYSNFTKYLCKQEKHRKFLFSCDESAIDAKTIHTNDIPLIDKKNNFKLNPEARPALMGVLTDWFALALAKDHGHVGRSTFSQSALLPYYV